MYLIVNVFTRFAKGVNVFEWKLLIPVSTLTLLVVYLFSMLYIYNDIDELAKKQFAVGHYCGGFLKCSNGDRWIRINRPIEKNYRKVIENGCVVVRSPTYALVKIQDQVAKESCHNVKGEE